MMNRRKPKSQLGTAITGAKAKEKVRRRRPVEQSIIQESELSTVLTLKEDLLVERRKPPAEEEEDDGSYETADSQSDLEEGGATAEEGGATEINQREAGQVEDTDSDSQSESELDGVEYDLPILLPDEQDETTYGCLRMPRRPEWNYEMEPEVLKEKEEMEFLAWRRSLSKFVEGSGLVISPYEINLDIWRQLWRVVERSDVIAQVVDARNPLFYWNKDLEAYIKEVEPSKKPFIVLNKADFLSNKQRAAWASYFADQGVEAAFFTSLPSDPEESPSATSTETELPAWRILSPSQLVQRLKAAAGSVEKAAVTIGLVGYPNVGKSSVINCLLDRKIVPVSATPGKTKHFQTHFLEHGVVLCDSPGLVFPKIVNCKEELVINGVTPPDRVIQNYDKSIGLICENVPRGRLERRYGIKLPASRSGEDLQPTSLELLTSLAYSRGYITRKGVADVSKASRMVLKDYICGSLLHCFPPPGFDEDFDDSEVENAVTLRKLPDRGKLFGETLEVDLDQGFFDQGESNLHVLSRRINAEKPAVDAKPWRVYQKAKRNSKVKARIRFAHLDD